MIEKIYFKNGEFVDQDDQIIKNIHQVTSTAFRSNSTEKLVNETKNEEEIILDFIKNNKKYQEANAYLVGSNMEHKDECSIVLPVTLFTIIQRKKKE